jgi:hypothetical protein
MHPDFFARERRLYDPAAVDVAVVEKLIFSFATKFQSMRSSPKALAESPEEPAFFVEDYDGLAAHARFVDGMPDIDISLRILAKAVRISPHEARGRY